MRTRTKVYVAVGVASGAAAYLLGMSISLSVAIGLVAPILLAATPRFLLATVKGAFTPGPPRGDRRVDDDGHGVRRPCRADRPRLRGAGDHDRGDRRLGRRPDRRESARSRCGAVQTAVTAGRGGRRPRGRRGCADARLHEDNGRHQPRIHPCRSQTRGVARVRARRRIGAAETPVDRPAADRPRRRPRPSAARPARRRRLRRSRGTTPSAQAGTGRCRDRWRASRRGDPTAC